VTGGRPGTPPPLPWAVLVIAAALIGGLAAAELVHVSLAVAVAVSIIAGAIAVLAAARWPARPADPGRPGSGIAASERRPPAQTTTGAPYPSSQPRPPGSDGLAQPAPPETVVQLLPASGKQEWWDAPQGVPAASPAARRAPAPDLASYLASTFIAQCPNCGAFRLDFRRARNGWEFRCESCRYTWSWRHGTPWPPVRVAPTRRRELSPR
jgi:hypothetical protein